MINRLGCPPALIPAQPFHVGRHLVRYRRCTRGPSIFRFIVGFDGDRKPISSGEKHALLRARVRVCVYV